MTPFTRSLLRGATLALALLAARPVDGLQDARSDFRALRKDYSEAFREFRAELQRIRVEEGAEAAALYEAEWHPATGFVELAWEQAEAYAGEDGETDFLYWILQFGRADEGGALGTFTVKSLDRLQRVWKEGEGLERFLDQAGYFPWSVDRALAVLGDLHRRLETPATRMRIEVLRCRLAVNDGDDEQKAAARGELARLAETTAGTDLAAEVERLVFVLENLQVGCTAPEITAKDLDGVEFKLSDYRGKVVLLDFWGDW